MRSCRICLSGSGLFLAVSFMLSQMIKITFFYEGWIVFSTIEFNSNYLEFHLKLSLYILETGLLCTGSLPTRPPWPGANLVQNSDLHYTQRDLNCLSHFFLFPGCRLIIKQRGEQSQGWDPDTRMCDVGIPGGHWTARLMPAATFLHTFLNLFLIACFLLIFHTLEFYSLRLRVCHWIPLIASHWPVSRYIKASKIISPSCSMRPNQGDR